MAKIDRTPELHQAHTHHCPDCNRIYTCSCGEHKTDEELLCRDCEDKG